MLEKMSDFFTARVDGYDEHMIENVEGCKEAYIEMANIDIVNITLHFFHKDIRTMRYPVMRNNTFVS